MPNENEGDGRKLSGYYEGPIIDINDPEKLGRVRVRLPGRGETTWAFPIGMPGSGGPKRGGWTPPPLGAEVGVMFKDGDPDHPRYISGPIGRGEAPDEVEDASVEEAARDIPFIHQGRRWKIVADERKGKARLAIEDKVTGDMYEIDGVKCGLKLKATTAMSIECDGAIDINCATFTVNGRRMAPNKKPW